MSGTTRLAILGSTGSIGSSTLDVVARHPDKYRVTVLSAQRRDDILFEQCNRFQPDYAVLLDEEAAARLQQNVTAAGLDTEVLCGAEALERVVSLPEVDAVMAAIVGAAGLRPTLAAARAGKKILLANKETLVMAGAVFMDAVRESGSVLLPIDSEHNAVFQSLPHDYSGDMVASGVEKILLTASGGPFRNTPLSGLLNVTPEQACAHPNWSMGRKISVDSATMMNKGLEVIEACWLFDTGPERIQVLVHPQSVIHSMVEYADGSVLAQLGNPDMRTPIAHALAWPERMDSGVAGLDLVAIGTLSFEAADVERFPCLALGFAAARAGSGVSAALNAANEVAVEAFLDERIRFTQIPEIIDATLQGHDAPEPASLEEVLHIDSTARVLASRRVSRLAA